MGLDYVGADGSEDPLSGFIATAPTWADWVWEVMTISQFVWKWSIFLEELTATDKPEDASEETEMVSLMMMKLKTYKEAIKMSTNFWSTSC